MGAALSSVAGSQTIVRKEGQFQLKIYDGKLQLWLWSGATAKSTGHHRRGRDDRRRLAARGVTYDGSTARIYRNGAQVASQALRSRSPPAPTRCAGATR